MGKNTKSEEIDEEDVEISCPTCDDTGLVTQNAGMCGGCEHCGGQEEKEVPCPDCQDFEPADFSGATEGDR